MVVTNLLYIIAYNLLRVDTSPIPKQPSGMPGHSSETGKTQIDQVNTVEEDQQIETNIDDADSDKTQLSSNWPLESKQQSVRLPA